MDASINRFFHHAGHYAAGEICTFAAGFISFPILTRVLTPADYGVMSVLTTTLWIFLAFSRAGLAEATVRFYREYDDPAVHGGRDRYFATFFLGTLACLALVLVIFLLSGRLIVTRLLGPEFADYTWILGGLIITGTLSMRMLNFLRAQQRTRFFNAAMVVGRYFTLAISLGLLFLVAKSLRVFLIGSLAGEVVMTGALLLLFLRESRPRLSGFSMPLFRRGLAFGLPLVGMELGYLLLKSADRYILQMSLGAESVGLFSVAANLGHYVKDLILYPLMYALTPLYIQIWHDQGREATIRFISSVADIVIALIIPVIFFFVLLGQDVIVVLASAKYAAAAHLLGWIVAATMLWALLPVYAAGIFIEKKTRIISLVILIAVGLDIILNLLFIRLWGIFGSCLASLLTYAFMAAALTAASSRYLPVRIDLRLAGKSLLAASAASAAIYWTGSAGGLAGLVLKGGAAVAIYAALLILLDHKLRARVRALRWGKTPC